MTNDQILTVVGFGELIGLVLVAVYVIRGRHYRGLGGVALWLLALATFGYFIPVAVAYTRHHPNLGPTVAVNVFLGWTLVGWVVALVMALQKPVDVRITVTP